MMLRFGTMKPPKDERINSTREPTVVDATIVWENEAIKRKMDIDARCTPKHTRNWRRNLIGTNTIYFKMRCTHIYINQIQNL